MKNYALLLQTQLCHLPFSSDCMRWFADAGVHTVEDTEEDITLLLESKYYTAALLHEMIIVIREYMEDEKGQAALQQAIVEKQQVINRNHNIIKALIRMIGNKRNKG